MITHRLPISPRRAGAVAALCLVACVAAGVAPAQAGPRAYALVGNSLLPFDVDHPQLTGAPIPITGLFGGETLVGIDIRPMNGHLYGVAIGPVGGSVQLYHIGLRTGIATRVGDSQFFVKGNGVTNDPVIPTHFGVDFDPERDHLKVVNAVGQNFRLDPDTGAAVDGDFAAPGINMDPPITGAIDSVDAAAFTSNDEFGFDPLMFTLSAASRTLNIQDGFSGLQLMPLPVTLGGAALNFVGVSGFDILPGIRALGSPLRATGSAIALLSLTPTAAPGLYRIDLETGAATLVGPLGGNVSAPVRGLAVQGERAPGGRPAIVLTSNGIARFNTAALTLGQMLGSISGMTVGDTLVGLDWRPQTGQLYGLAGNENTGALRLYRLSPMNQTATVIGHVRLSAGVFLNFSGSPLGFGFDFDPTADVIRVTHSDGRNYRVNPDNAFLIGDAEDSPTNGLPGVAVPTAAAYTNNFAQVLNAGAPTTLYTLDPTTNQLLIQSPPNSGTQSQGLPITLNGSPLDFDLATGFDIPSDVRVGSAGVPAAGRAYATLTVAGVTRLYTIDLANGAATLLLGPLTSVGVPLPLHGLTVGDGPLALTTVTLTSGANPSAIGQPVTLTATVVPATAAGAIAFTSGGVAIAGCESQPLAAGTATCVTTFGTAGAANLAAVYQGDDRHLPDMGTLTQAVTGLSSSTTLSASPTLASPGRLVTLVATVTPGGGIATSDVPTGSVTFFDGATSLGVVALTNGRATLATSALAAGAHQITAAYGGDGQFAASVTSGSVLVTIGVAGPLTQYFAEGAGGFFHTAIGLVNASDINPAHVSVWLYPDGADPVELLMTLAPLGRQTLDLDSVMGQAAGVSALITSDQPVAATRQMTWGDPVFGSTLESGIPTTSPTWYFAEGATGAFSLYYLIQNPGAAAATVTLTHLTEGGGTPIVQQEIVPPFSRRTVSVHDVPGLTATSMATAISATAPIVAERAMYVSGPRLFEGGASSRGATTLQQTWSFAEGATGFFRTYLLFGNPGADAATVTVRYQLPDGDTIVKSYDMPAESRRTVDVNGEDPLLASTAVSMSVLSTRPIVAERAMWWGEPMWNEGSAALGSVETGYLWAIGEGAEGGPSQDATFVLVANGSSAAGTIKLTVSYDDGTRQEREYALPGDGRLTVRVGDDFAAARNHRFSVFVESLTDGVPIAVDVSRYQSAHAFVGAGGAAAATRIVR